MGYREIIGEGNLDESYLAPVNFTLHASSKDVIQVCESFAEALEALKDSFCAFIRFYERYDCPYEMVVWISWDAEIDMAEKYLGRKRGNFLGEWKRKDWKKLSRQIEVWSNRTFVIRKAWLPKLQEILIGEDSALQD